MAMAPKRWEDVAMWVLKLVTASMAVTIASKAGLAQFAEGNRRTDMMLQQGNMQMQMMTQPRFGGSPAFPLFRCDGQRPPIFGGAGACQNWRVLDLQEKVLRQQYEIQQRQLKKLRKGGDR